ncbi:DUF2461 domain-containing protein [Chryseobacterium sp. ERMR1:04]|uniref:DUF2461 domain-containing protein n=1 Tax=Chryseobacterium sp. ERMR1:04 TaxID=1705393 RepID=UPI0006C84950|nr:DUF2461 domain-containing protein [Chryseobacterium sp. ERMR1:04]KPH12431.1 hypothetical protein AMQ68_16090 [Chryseobacterium sp. ERMR1:04]
MKKAFEFLNNLKENNNREWFAQHKAEYDLIVKENKVFFNKIYTELQEYDHLKGLHIFRIYRDLRFSKDQSEPYKTNFGVGYSRSKPMLRGGYYIQLEPNNSFVGGGFWGPDTKDLLRIRKEFELNTTAIEKIISNENFIQYFRNIEGDAVKTAPRGFDKNHPAIDLIRKKQYVVMRKFTDKEVLSGSFQKEVILTLLAMRPFFDYMSEVLTTDLNGEPLF